MRKGRRQYAKDEDRLRAVGRRRDLAEPALGMTPDAWRQLKKQQRDIREAYFVEGKNAYRKLRTAILRKVRDEYRSEWRQFYAARKNGAGSAVLQEMRTELIARQQKSLRERRDVAGAELRQVQRDDYLAVLERQRTERADLQMRRKGYAQKKGLNARGAVSGPRREITPVLVLRSMSRKFRLAAAEIRGERLGIVESHLGVQSGLAINGHWRHRPPRDLLTAPLPERNAATFPSLNSSSRIQPAQGCTINRTSLSARVLTVQSKERQFGAGKAACSRVLRQRTFARLGAEANSARAVALALLYSEYGQKLATVQQRFRGAALEAAFTALMVEKHAAERAIITKLANEARTHQVASVKSYKSSYRIAARPTNQTRVFLVTFNQLT